MRIGKAEYRVSYSDTDKMGFMHHSNYLRCYEVARGELFRSLGIPYSKIEDEGILFPITDAVLKFYRPSFYDQIITINTVVKALSGARITFEHKITNETGKLINEGQVSIGCINSKTGKPCPLPQKVANALKDFLVEQ